jgi:hypothetical protein
MTKNKPSLLMDSLFLPRFEKIEELAELTGLSTKLLYCLSKNTEKYYSNIKISKRNGSPREIFIPSYTLDIIQKWILKKILNYIMPSNRAMAFRFNCAKKFGHKQNAFYHSNTLYGLSIDLKDFFPSITSNKVYTIFSNFGYNNFAAFILTKLCTLNGKLPQGSATSPAISNLICISMDKRLIGFCEKRGIRFTRYADDMYFSCDDKALLLKNFSIIKKIIEDSDFILNDKKTYFHTPSNKKMITGVLITSNIKEEKFELKAPKALKKKIRTEIYNCIISGNYEKKEHILGEIHYVNYIEKENKNNYIEYIKKYILNLSKKIIYFPELVKAYNKNLFFINFEPLETLIIRKNSINEVVDFENVLNYRKSYLKKHLINDICQYIDL